MKTSTVINMPKFAFPKLTPTLPRTYWVVDGLFLAGAYAGQPNPKAHYERLSELFNVGIRTCVNLMEEDETNNDGKPFVPYQDLIQDIANQANEAVDCVRFPIVDRSTTTHAHMKEILDTIDRSLDNKRPVYLHCFGGIGRTGTVVCCWLLRHGYASKDNVFALLAKLRLADTETSSREAPENTKQKAFVLDSPVGGKTASPNNTIPAATKLDWFTKLTGFSERSTAEVHANIHIQNGKLTSRVNNATYQCGRLEIASLKQLRQQVASLGNQSGQLKVSQIVSDAKALHVDAANAGAVFQVASQFNLLEMISPSVTPDDGIGIYDNDPTQGPACAIACGAGTIYRNYFVDFETQVGQSASKQIDCLAHLGNALGNTNQELWKMQNGYALPTSSGLKHVVTTLQRMSEKEIDSIREKLQIGVQWDTQVTLHNSKHCVTQAYCSALPVAYSGLPSQRWEPFARLVLEAAYEATMATAALNATKTGNKTLYLTLLGGGAFGNDQTWIEDAMRRAVQLYKSIDLDVRIVSYRFANPSIRIGDDGLLI